MKDSIKRQVRLMTTKLLGDARFMSMRARCVSDNDDLSRFQSVQSPKVVLLGCPDYSNLGDHAIALAERIFLDGVQLPVVVLSGPIKQQWNALHSLISNDDILCFQGGGNMGTLYTYFEDERLALIDRFRENEVIIFPQTFSYGSSAYERRYVRHMERIYGRHKNLHLIAREQMSYQRMKEHFPDADVLLTPDIVLSLSGYKATGARDGLLLCMRSDKERALSEGSSSQFVEAANGKYGSVRMTDTLSPKAYLSPNEGAFEVKEKIAELSHARLVVTDRIHGMIFCALSGTPCIALDNSNGKVGQEYKWISRLPYISFAHNPDEAVEMLRGSAPEPGVYPSDEMARLFEPISDIFFGK